LEKQKGNLPFEYDLIIYLIHIVIFNDPTQDCNLKGKNSDWKNLPFTKSLFHAEKDCRLPIGNLTSQLFGNIYMNEFVHFVKRDLDIKYYGRYVDDFILIHPDKGYLLWMIKKIDSYLSTELNLQLHPHKIYLQHYTKGVAYLVAIIKPHRTYVGSRIKGNFYEAIKEQNEITKSQIPTKSEVDAFVTIMTSYLGIMKHHKTYKLRRQMITQNLSENWWKYTYATNNFGKFIMRKA
jgi:RNA-directed DNA polymerase